MKPVPQDTSLEMEKNVYLRLQRLYRSPMKHISATPATQVIDFDILAPRKQ